MAHVVFLPQCGLAVKVRGLGVEDETERAEPIVALSNEGSYLALDPEYVAERMAELATVMVI